MSDKIKRSQVDDINRRNNAADSYKNRSFGNKKSITDEYTGKRIFYNANKHINEKQSNVDHIVPLDEQIRRYGSDLTPEQIRTMANADANLANTNASLNKSKGALNNHEYIAKKYTEAGAAQINDVSETLFGKKIFKTNKKAVDCPDAVTSVNMLKEEVKAEAHIRTQATKYKIENTVNEIKNSKVISSKLDAVAPSVKKATAAGREAAFVTATVSSLTNLVGVVKGEQDIKQAVKNVGKDTVRSFGSAAGISVVQDGVVAVAKKAGAKDFAKLAGKNLPIMQLTMAVEIGGIVANYLDGNISGEECSAQIVCGTAGVLAANMAFALGGPVAAVVTSLVVGEITRAVTKYQMERRLDKKRQAEFKHIINTALQSLAQQKQRIDEYNKARDAYMTAVFDGGFEHVMQGVYAVDDKAITQGLNNILAVFKQKCAFQSLEEFNNFFDDKDAVLTL